MRFTSGVYATFLREAFNVTFGFRFEIPSYDFLANLFSSTEIGDDAREFVEHAIKDVGGHEALLTSAGWSNATWFPVCSRSVDDRQVSLLFKNFSEWQDSFGLAELKNLSNMFCKHEGPFSKSDVWWMLLGYWTAVLTTGGVYAGIRVALRRANLEWMSEEKHCIHDIFGGKYAFPIFLISAMAFAIGGGLKLSDSALSNLQISGVSAGSGAASVLLAVLPQIIYTLREFYQYRQHERAAETRALLLVPSSAYSLWESLKNSSHRVASQASRLTRSATGLFRHTDPNDSEMQSVTTTIPQLN